MRLFCLGGPLPYDPVHDFMKELAKERRRGGEDALILCEHAPVVTLGRNADPTGLLLAPEAYAARGVALRRIERGGQATYHGPGQLVGYPVVDLRALSLGVRRYVELLEEAMIRTAAAFGIEAARREGRPGIYVGEEKLGAVGVAVSGGVTLHGFALNVAPDLAPFELIVPCGERAIVPTSLARLLGRAPSMEEAALAAASALEMLFGVSLREEEPPALATRPSP